MNDGQRNAALAIVESLEGADKRLGTKERPPVSAEMQRRIELAEILTRSGFFSDVKQVAQAIVKLRIAEELGIPEVSAMTSIYVFGTDGKTIIQIGAHLLAGLIKRSGKYNYKIIETDEKVCVIEFWGLDYLGIDGWSVIGTEKFTMEDAKRAGLSNKSNWQKWPSEMLYARCIARGQRRHCPDALSMTVYVPEEFDTQVTSSGTIEGLSKSVVDDEFINVTALKVSDEPNRGHGEEGLGKGEPTSVNGVQREDRGGDPSTLPPTPDQGAYEVPARPRSALTALLLTKADDKEEAKALLTRAAMDFFNLPITSANDLTTEQALQIHKAISTGTYTVTP